jgi:transcriptional regulator GlxA family with amidase domain
VCAGGNPASFDDAKAIAWLRRTARTGCEIGGVSGGPFILAKAGILDGYRCTVHWEHLPAFTEAFPDIVPTRTLFEIDRGRLTCGGGVAALDMMHAIIRRDHGQSLAARVSDWYLQTAVRLGDSTQRISLTERVGTNNRNLIAAIGTMERQLASPLPRVALAKAANISIRQLERLFARHLGVTIDQHYVSLRLAKARALLRQTSLPVIQIGAECGFSNASHFARVYRMAFGMPPSKDRMPDRRSRKART